MTTGPARHGKNESESRKPVPGDGTLTEKKSKDANWFGTSKEPQEEYIESTERKVESKKDKPPPAVRPTMFGDKFAVLDENEKKANNHKDSFDEIDITKPGADTSVE